MQQQMLHFLRCPISHLPFKLEVIAYGTKRYNGKLESFVKEGILYTPTDWCYPVINGVPRITVEAFTDFETFMQQHVPNFEVRKKKLLSTHGELIDFVRNKNKRTKSSFSLEWSLFNYKSDKVWEADSSHLLERFLEETGETIQSIKGKYIFDAGCGNGLMNQFIAKAGATVLGMDFSNSIENAFAENEYSNAWFIQGDIEYPPIMPLQFDIVHASGVLQHTRNTKNAFLALHPAVKYNGNFSCWLYHPRKNFIHQVFNFIRNYSSKLPIKLQYYLYLITLFPASFIIKKLKGNPQNSREMMIAIMDWFSPEYRWEHTPEEASQWFLKAGYQTTEITTTSLFGFSIVAHRKNQ